ncbi:MAG: ABC transporter ATP-binding protein [candidate division WOR-3 bacterium]
MQIIELKNIKKSFKIGFLKKEVLKGISLEIKKGEIFGFLGPNGAGKTTTIKIIIGLLKQDEGEVKITGSTPFDKNIRRKIGFLPEQPYFYDHLTGYEFLEFTATLQDIPEKVFKKRVDELFKKVGLEDAKNKKIRSYSRGMLQRIGIANALISDPEILILDEPFTGLDPIGRREMKDFIYEQKKYGKTIFFSSHILPDAEEICDRVGVIVDGIILREGPLDEILKERIKKYEIVLKNIEEEFVKKYEYIKRGEEIIIYADENEVEKILKELIENFKHVKIIRISPEIYSLEEWFVEIVKSK